MKGNQCLGNEKIKKERKINIDASAALIASLEWYMREAYSFAFLAKKSI